MTDLPLAIAFVTICTRLGINNSERGKILEEAGGLGRLLDYLESRENPPASLIGGIREEAGRQRQIACPVSWRPLTLVDKDYPERLRHISRPPAVLFVSGRNWMALNGPSVIAVIGSRRPSAYGIEVTKKLTAPLRPEGTGCFRRCQGVDA